MPTSDSYTQTSLLDLPSATVPTYTPKARHPHDLRREPNVLPPGYASGDAIDMAFWRFHTSNPDVYEALVSFAKLIKQRGRSRIGMKMLWERLRWFALFETADPSGFRLNNNYTSRYARELMLRERCSDTCTGCERPDCLVGIFELRKLSTTSVLETEDEPV